MDIWLIQTKDKVQICPKSVTGMLWLQTHFEQEYWEALASNQATIAAPGTSSFLEDAQAAGLKLNFLQNSCIVEKF